MGTKKNYNFVMGVMIKGLKAQKKIPNPRGGKQAGGRRHFQSQDVGAGDKRQCKKCRVSDRMVSPCEEHLDIS